MSTDSYILIGNWWRLWKSVNCRPIQHKRWSTVTEYQWRCRLNVEQVSIWYNDINWHSTADAFSTCNSITLVTDKYGIRNQITFHSVHVHLDMPFTKPWNYKITCVVVHRPQAIFFLFFFFNSSTLFKDNSVVCTVKPVHCITVTLGKLPSDRYIHNDCCTQVSFKLPWRSITSTFMCK